MVGTLRDIGSTLAVVLIGGWTIPAFAQTYDDPSVAICEVVTKAKLPVGATYARDEAAIDGLFVRLRYSVSVLNTRPIAKEDSCEFIRNSAGSFQLRGYRPQRTSCAVEKATYEKTQNWRTPTPHAEAAAARSKLDQCQQEIADEVAKMNREFNERDKPLMALGIYPIEPSRTELKAP